MKKLFWSLFGAFNQLLFGLTVVRLFIFLRGGDDFRPLFSNALLPEYSWVLADTLLAVQFAVLHSLMLWPPARKKINSIVPGALYGSFFCFVSCLCLILTMEFWQSSRFHVWHATGLANTAFTLLFCASWLALTYSLWLTGFGFQTGFSPWWAYVRCQKTPPRPFMPRGAYKVIRHPVYLSFLGLVWFNPAMSLDRLTLALLWTTHIFVGSYLKDRRLEHYIGEPYREYEQRVPGYPLLKGALGKLRPALPVIVAYPIGSALDAVEPSRHSMQSTNRETATSCKTVAM